MEELVPTGIWSINKAQVKFTSAKIRLKFE